MGLSSASVVTNSLGDADSAVDLKCGREHCRNAV
jgi:hypothetical protein